MRGVIAQLRDVVPIRALTSVEAVNIAERQATRLLELLEVKEPPITESALASLPRIQIERIIPSPVAGATQWSRGRWLIVVNGADPNGRQRFSICHELKHIIDNPFIKVLYPPVGNLSSFQRAEAICDYFAGCLLMPRPWVKRAWWEGVQDIPALAQRFDVSRQAMQVRLLQVGLLEPGRRHVAAA